MTLLVILVIFAVILAVFVRWIAQQARTIQNLNEQLGNQLSQHITNTINNQTGQTHAELMSIHHQFRQEIDERENQIQVLNGLLTECHEKVTLYERANAVLETRLSLTDDREQHLLRLQTYVSQLEQREVSLKQAAQQRIGELEQYYQDRIASIEQAGLTNALRVSKLETELDVLREPVVERKRDLEEQIRGAYGLIRQYEEMLPLENDPTETERYMRSKQKQEEVLRERLHEYHDFCHTVSLSLPSDIVQLVRIYCIDKDERSLL